MNMKKIGLILLFFFTFIVLSYPAPVSAQAIDPQYLFIRKSPMHCIPDCTYLWNFDYPQNINTATMLDIINLVGTRGGDQRKLGIGVEINYNSVYDFTRIKQSLQNLLLESKTNNIPVYINLGGFQWWGVNTVGDGWNGRPDLWNWWDSTKAGYNLNNKNNVEWTCWDNSCATNKAWRNWGGGDFEVRPHPNLASRAFIDSSKTKLAELVPIIVNWYTSLPFDKKWLLGGISNGTETDIGGNYRVYGNNDIPFEQDPSNPIKQLGYAAVKTAGLRSSGNPPTVAELNEVISRYTNELDKFVFDQGIPRSKIFNHIGGSDIYAGTFPQGVNYPTTAGALTKYGAPGWSFYGDVTTNPQNFAGLTTTLNQINNSEWTSPEWFTYATDYNGWVGALKNSLNYRNNRFINISNWEDHVRGNSVALDAIKTVLSEPPSCWVSSPVMQSIAINSNTATLTWQKGRYDHAYLLISTIGEFGIDGVLINKNITQVDITNVTTFTKSDLNTGKYYWQFTADGCVDAQYHFQNKTTDGSFVISTPAPLPGDFTETGDVTGDHVNIYDYNELVSKFGNPYTIFDYNDLVTNYDK